MSRIRVLHTVGSLELGGGQKLTVLTACALDPEEFDVTVCNLGPPGPYTATLRAHGVEVVELGLEIPPHKNSPLRLLRGIIRLARVVLTGRWDIVHTHLFTSAAFITPLARLAGAITVGTSHRVYYPRLQPPLERLLSRIQDAIVVDSAAVGEILRDATGIAGDKYVVIHNGIDLNEFQDPPTRSTARRELELTDEDLVIAEIARLVAFKGHDHLIDAFAQLAGRWDTALLLIVGDGPERQALESRVGRHGLENRVRFLGGRDDLATILAAIDILALPSTFEGFGIIQAEAMYMQVPVVATSAGGSLEVVADGETGILVPYGDIAMLTDALDRLARDPSLRERMGSAGRERVLASFTSDVMGRRYGDLYRSLVRPRRRL